jgi:hypothetical protein
MADVQYVRENRIRTEMAAETTAMKKQVLLFGGPLALGITLFQPALFFVWFGILGIIYFFARQADPVRESGIAGEEYTLKILKTLPDSYVIFNQLEVPDERSRTGRRELDFVVCGPNGVFVVESKNHNGRLEGSADDKEWTIHKVGRGGTPYSSTVRNPVRQVRQQVGVLSSFLKGKQITDWITGIVALSSDNSLDGIDGGSVPVVCATDIAEVVTSHIGRHSSGYTSRTVAALAGLVSG